MHHPLRIKSTVLQIPLRMRDNLYVACRQVSVSARDSLPQGVSCFFCAQGLARDPHAEFVVLQPGCEIGNQDVE